VLGREALKGRAYCVHEGFALVRFSQGVERDREPLDKEKRDNFGADLPSLSNRSPESLLKVDTPFSDSLSTVLLSSDPFDVFLPPHLDFRSVYNTLSPSLSLSSSPSSPPLSVLLPLSRLPPFMKLETKDVLPSTFSFESAVVALGTLNSRRTFLHLDLGCSHTAISLRAVEELKLEYEKGAEGRTGATAGGRAPILGSVEVEVALGRY